MKLIRYIGASDEQVRWGENDDPRGLLKRGNIYEVEYEEVHSWHTKYSLKGIAGRFNSVCFEMMEKKSWGYQFWWCLLWPYYKLWLPFTIYLRKALGGE